MAAEIALWTVVAVGGGPLYFKVKERMRRDVGAFKSTTSRFKFDNFRRYPGRQCGGFIGFGNEWCMAIK